ncbi:hypothetical protein ACH4U6_11370 [Streptomyces netropsis]|uniref:hypothetical protein n=1 Tax=Streptomyces netropsis TaxID=55404 RepID=UPI0037B4A161
MRINKIASAAIAVAACGSLVVGVTGPALAAAPEPVPFASWPVAPEPKAGATQQQLDAMNELGTVLSLSARIAKEAQSPTPDAARLATLREQLRAAAGRLLASAARASGSSASDPRAKDAVADVKAQLDKLVKDVTDLLAAVLAKDLVKVTAGLTAVVADLQALLLAVPKLATSALPLPLPGL